MSISKIITSMDEKHKRYEIFIQTPKKYGCLFFECLKLCKHSLIECLQMISKWISDWEGNRNSHEHYN